MSICLVLRGTFAIFIFVLKFQCGGPSLWCIYPHTGIQVILYVCLSISLSVNPRHFLAIIRAAHNCVQRMRPPATGSNPLSGSIIFPSVVPSGCPEKIFNFFICIHFQCGGSASECIYIDDRVIYLPEPCFYDKLCLTRSFWVPPGFWRKDVVADFV